MILASSGVVSEGSSSRARFKFKNCVFGLGSIVDRSEVSNKLVRIFFEIEMASSLVMVLTCADNLLVELKKIWFCLGEPNRLELLLIQSEEFWLVLGDFSAKEKPSLLAIIEIEESVIKGTEM